MASRCFGVNTPKAVFNLITTGTVDDTSSTGRRARLKNIQLGFAQLRTDLHQA
jgi:hypothetical protein